MPDISLVIQWKASCDMCTLWQRFGQGAHGFGLQAIALFLVEPMYFDETKEQKAGRKAKKDEGLRRKADEELLAKGKQKQNETNDSQQTHKKRRNAVDSEMNTLSTSLRMLNPGHPTSTGMTDHLSLVPNTLIEPSSSCLTPADNLACLRSRLVTHSFGHDGPIQTTFGSHSDHCHSTIDNIGIIPSVNSDFQVQERGEQQVDREMLDSDSETNSELEVSVLEGVDLCEERCVVYAEGAGKRLVESKGRKKKDGTELEPAIDDMINAGSGNMRFKCFCQPPTLYFGNDKICRSLTHSIINKLTTGTSMQPLTTTIVGLTFQMDVHAALALSRSSAVSSAPQHFFSTSHKLTSTNQKPTPLALESRIIPLVLRT